MDEYTVGDIVVLPMCRIFKLLSFRPESHSWEMLCLFTQPPSIMPRPGYRTQGCDAGFLNKHGRKLLPHEMTAAILSGMINPNDLNHSIK